jgi:DNA polymerase-3 subunit delta'
MDFDTVIGNDIIKTFVLKEIKKEQLPNSFLFFGKSGIGKHLFAIELAKILNCESNDNSPCNECFNCKRLNEKEHPDVIEIDPKRNIKKKTTTENSKSAKIITIKEEVNKIIEWALYKPSIGKKKIVIIDDTADLSVAAMNNLLKIIEEPPLYIYMILISNNESKILPTILSRCQVLNFVGLRDSEIYAICEKSNIEKNNLILRLSDGRFGYYKKLIEGDFEIFMELTNAIMNIIYRSKTIWEIEEKTEREIAKKFNKTTREYFVRIQDFFLFFKKIVELTLIKRDIEKEFRDFYNIIVAINHNRIDISTNFEARLDIAKYVNKIINKGILAAQRYMNIELLFTEIIKELGIAFRGIH